MAQVIPFEEQAVASLRRKLGAVESANADLMAFARGHSGAVTAIHQAVLAALSADSMTEALAVATGEWPALLAIDQVAVALDVGGKGFRADAHGIHRVDGALVRRAIPFGEPIRLESVGSGHPLFGDKAGLLRGQALIALEAGEVRGLLLLGQRSAASMGGRHGEQLLEFLGASLAAIIRRWTLIG